MVAGSSSAHRPRLLFQFSMHECKYLTPFSFILHLCMLCSFTCNLKLRYLELLVYRLWFGVPFTCAVMWHIDLVYIHFCMLVITGEYLLFTIYAIYAYIHTGTKRNEQTDILISVSIPRHHCSKQISARWTTRNAFHYRPTVNHKQ